MVFVPSSFDCVAHFRMGQSLEEFPLDDGTGTDARADRDIKAAVEAFGSAECCLLQPVIADHGILFPIKDDASGAQTVFGLIHDHSVFSIRFFSHCF